MSYAIIGLGKIGAALARRFARGGIAVGIANTRRPESIEAMAKQLGTQVTVMTSLDVHGADVIILTPSAHQSVNDQQNDRANHRRNPACRLAWLIPAQRTPHIARNQRAGNAEDDGHNETHAVVSGLHRPRNQSDHQPYNHRTDEGKHTDLPRV